MKQEQQQCSRCPHFKKIISKNQLLSDYSFIKPHYKGWICLYDGCEKKNGSIPAILPQISKMEANHKVFLSTTKLQIFCFECNIEITDEQEKAYQIRKLCLSIDMQKEKTLFGSNIQYPPGFKKQKAGLAGTLGEELNSYVNASIQLLAHLSPFYQISGDVNVQTVKDQCLRQVFKCVNKIRQGVYRIVETSLVQKEIKKKDEKFKLYSFKTPTNFIYEILRTWSNQFEFRGPLCYPKSMSPQVKENNEKQFPKITSYSPMKELFAGTFIWKLRCPTCENETIKKIQYQCLRLEQSEPAINKNNSKLQDLIEQIFDFHKLYENSFGQNQIKCNSTQQCVKFLPVIQDCFIIMPNILLLEFVSEQGVNVQYPDVLDLTRFTDTKKIGSAIEGENQSLFYYVGSIAKVNQKYVTHIREKKQGAFKDILFDDSLIKQDVGKPTRIVNAIYKQNPLKKHKTLCKNVESSIIVQVENYVPLPDFWYWYLFHLRKVQSLVNPFICSHGLLAPGIKSKSNIVRKIPPSIYEYLVEVCGGLPTKIKKQNQYCQICEQKMQIIKQLKKSEREMAKFADQLSSKKSRVCVDIDWFQNWRKYLYEKCDEPYKLEQYQRPGQINNKRGMNEKGEVDQNKYKKVSQEVWYFFKKFYGGGPLITQNLSQPSLALVQAIDLRYQKIKELIVKLSQLK